MLPDDIARCRELATQLLQQGHCRYAAARTESGARCEPTDHLAVQWCALERAAHELLPDSKVDAHFLFIKAQSAVESDAGLPRYSLIAFNDTPSSSIERIIEVVQAPPAKEISQ